MLEQRSYGALVSTRIDRRVECALERVSLEQRRQGAGKPEWFDVGAQLAAGLTLDDPFGYGGPEPLRARSQGVADLRAAYRLCPDLQRESVANLLVAWAR